MSDVYKATKNKIVTNTQNNSDIFKATKNKQIDSTVYGKYKLKQEVENAVFKSMPTLSGDITPSALNDKFKKGMDEIATRAKAKNELIKSLEVSKAKKDKAKANYQNADKDTALAKIFNMVGGISNTTPEQANTLPNWKAAQDEFFGGIEKIENKGIPNSELKNKINNLSKKAVYDADSVEDVIAYLYFGKKGGFNDRTPGLLSTAKSSKYNNIYDNEKDTLIEIYNLYGAEEAKEYLEYIETRLNERYTADVVKGSKEFASKHPALALGTSFITKLGEGKAVAKSIADTYNGKGIDTNSPEYAYSYATNTMRQQIEKEQIKPYGELPALKQAAKITQYVGVDNIPSFIYNTLNSAIDSAINFKLAAGFGKAFGLGGMELNKFTSTANSIISGSQVAQETIIDAKQKGLSDSESINLGIMRAVIEGVTEKYSLDTIMDNPNAVLFKNFKSGLKRAFVAEGSEGVASNWLNRVADAIYYGDRNQITESYNGYLAKGLSQEEALLYTINDLFKEDASTFLAEGLSGLGTYAVHSISKANPKKIGKTIAGKDAEGQLIEIGLSLNEDSKAYKMSVQLRDSGMHTVADIGNLALEIIGETSQDFSQDIENAIYDRVKQLGGNANDANIVSSFFSKVYKNKIKKINLSALENEYFGQIKSEIENAQAGDWFFEVKQKIFDNDKIKSQVMSIVSTSKNKEALQLTDANSPSATPLSGSVIASNNNIPQGENVVNTNISTNEQDSSQNSNIEVLTVRKKNKQRKHTTAKEQAFIKHIADKLGVKVEFEHITSELLRSYGYEFNEGDILPDGYYDRDTKIIHIGYTAYNPVTFLFKHELTHFGEGTAQYNKFVESVKKSKTFKNWLEKQIGYKKVADAEEYYLFKIAKERGYKLNADGVLSEGDRNELMCEMIADFVGECIFTDDTSTLESMLNDLNPKERNSFIQYILDFLSYLKKKLAGNKDIVFEISRLEDNFNRMLSEAVQTKEKPPTESGENLQFSIVNLDNGKSYVQASRKVISGNSVAEWRSQISEFFNRALKNGPIEIQTIEGDVLTISKETANKARDKHISENGISRELSDNEFRIKLNAESHIDELSEISLSNKDAEGNKKIISDKKNHEIARDGFSYRTVYFQDFDGAYYRITLSVGENNNISTVYNVGKIKAEDIPNGNIVSAIGSKADMSSANSSVTQNLTAVNNNSMQESGNNSKKLQFSFARVQDENLISKAEEREEELLSKGKNWVITQLEIWDELGIIRDAAGEWIYEIDDSAMEFFPLGDAERELDPEIEELIKLENAKRLTDEKKKRFHELLNKHNYSIFRSGKLSDFIKHPKLFKKFPQLRDVNFKIDILKDDAKGGYIPETNTIVIDYAKIVDIQENLKKSKLNKSDDAYIEIEKYIIHEIQHALQEIEDREPGSSEEYWNKRYAREGKSQIKPDTGQELSAYGAYLYTKGEFEARETANRYKLTEKQRKGVFGAPYLGWGETISARDTVGVHSAEFSVPTDAEYIQAVEKGDINQLQEMVDNAARSNGYTERLYHQTGAEFTEFNTDNQVAGKFDWQLPTGMFLKPSDRDIGLKGKKQMELFAKTNNPLRFNDRSEAQEFWSERIEGYSEAVAEVKKIDNEYREKDDDAIMELQSYMRQWKKENPDAQKHDIYNDAKYQRLADKESGILDEWELKSDKASIKAKRLIDNFIANSDYDGIIIERDDDGKNRHTKSYVVFDSSQLKSAALVTYDNEGNVITLSERFNQEKKDIRFSVPSLEEVDSYSEEQYNNFGWVRANNVLSSTEYETLLSRYADYKHNDDKYPTTRFGEAVIFSFDHPSVVMYVKGSIETPEITKVIKMSSDIPLEIQSDIQKEIIENERNKVLLPWENVTSIFGEGLFTVNKKRDIKSFQEYERGRQGKISQGDSTNNRDEHNGTGSKKQNISNSEAGLNKPAFSMPSETAELLDMYESGEITKTEYQAAMEKYFDEAIAEIQDTAWGQQLELLRSNVKLKSRVKRQNEQLARRRSEISQEITAQREERSSKQKNIEHIRKTVSRIDKMLRTNSENKHVPEELKEEITKFISVFVANDRSPFDKKDLRNIYLTYSDALRESSVEDANSGLDEDVLRDIKSLRERLDGKTLRDLNYHETLLVRNIVDNFAQIIKWENEMFIAGKEYQYNEVGHKALSELTSKEAKKENVISKAVDSSIVYSNMTPVYFFNRIGGVFKTLFDEIVEAQNKWFKNAENAKTFIRQIKEKYHYSEWENDTFKFTTEKGDEIEITREQAMLLYATAKREYGNDFQKAEHLFRGGVVIEPSAKKLKEVVKKFKESDDTGRKRIAEAFSEEVDSRAHRITPEDVLKIKFWLSDEQLAYVDDFVEYLSTDMAALGNEISMQLYGIRKYNENYYIPYNSAQNFLYSQPGVTNEARLKHQSFTKNTVVGANNPLILSDFSTVCADHINRMCMYNALTMPLENMNKIFNFKTTSSGDTDVRSIQSEIERVHGKSAVSYIKTFIEDMNGNVRTSNTDKFINRWISKFKKGAVFASASVVVQQPSAIIRAMAYIKPKYFSSTTLKLSERDYQQCVQYAPVAGIKEMGRFDTGVGATTRNWLLQETPHGIKNKAKALLSSDSTYRDDKLSYFAAKADEITWAHIWAAVKAEIADTTDLRVGSKEYFDACGKRFTDVINFTQVYDSTLSCSQIMRSKSTGAQMLTAFMSEPTVSLNLLMSAVTEAKSGTKQGKQFAVNAVAAFVGSVVLNSLLKSLVTAARDDDEDKTYLEKYVGEFAENFVSDINPLALIPFVKDVLSIFEGYTVERADMNLFSDLAQSLKYLDSDSKSNYEKFESVMGSLAAFLGLPVKNLLRDGRAVYNLYNDIFVNDKVDRAVNNEVEGYIDEFSNNETYNSLDGEDKEKLEKRITETVREVQDAEADKKQRDEFDKLYAELRKSKSLYNKKRKEMLEAGYTGDEITAGVEIARIAYMKSIGIDIGEYLLYKIATSKKNADIDKSGGVSKEEKKVAIREMDIDEKIKNYFINQHK